MRAKAAEAGRGVSVLPQNHENRKIARQLREAGELLESQGANPFRARAYRVAAGTVDAMDGSLRDIFDAQGRAGLESLPGIGRGIASAIAEMLITGHWSQLERLRGDVDPIAIFQRVPGIGPDLARDIHETLHIDTLEALELACKDGAVRQVPGIGPRRAAAISAALTAMLDRRRAIIRRIPAPATSRPSVATLLEVDREYREKAGAGTLPTIAPRRFNPRGEAWLPVLHTRRDGWHFTVLYSNTARAHELGRTRDWVVVYFYDHEHAEGRHTVVTEPRGALAGKRVVRGRDAECRAHYASG
ncbi:MAG TPA: helix-hairpin-helix domain-containing protein [Burkholderiales bacterium]|nr:helix-hairpin-helix domain-containing protein [Burkholderiales bacterium]